MKELITLLRESDLLNTSQMAEILGKTQAEIERELERLKSENILLGWCPVLNLANEDESGVRAVIEIKTSPEREGGFDRLAKRISRFEEVESCYLVSGGCDLLTFVKGKNLRQVASFVSEHLALLEGVLSTSTHFMLRAYKERGFLLEPEIRSDDRPLVSP